MDHAAPTAPEAFTTFGALLRFLRLRAHLSQSELAEAVGYSEAHISRLEQGQRRPDPDMVRAHFVSALDLEASSPWALRLASLASALATPTAPANTPPLASPAPLSAPLPSGLLATKLCRPFPRPDQVSRLRLTAQLNELLAVPLTVVIAPAGFGKTRLLADWLQQVQHAEPGTYRLGAGGSEARRVRAAFLALDEGDNDRAHFVRYLLAAVQQAVPGAGAGTLAMAETPSAPPALLLQPLLNDLAALPDDLIFALDDYHTITAAPLHALMAEFVERLPPQVHLVLATRESPPLPLARLRSRGNLFELRAAHLRFTTEETGEFLRKTMGLTVGDADVAELERRTEGWAVGLQLAALMLRGKPDIGTVVQGFAGTTSYVTDYLAAEILNRLPDHLRQFLLRTSVLRRMCGELCDALLDLRPTAPDSYSRLLLEELEQRNLFLVPLDRERRWFRYHHLFTDVLRARLEEGASHDQIAELHRRASNWYASQGLAGEALEHAFAAGDVGLAANLLDQHAQRMISESGPEATMTWMARLPLAELETRPTLGLTYATALSYVDAFAESEVLLTALKRRLTEEIDPDAGSLLEAVEAIRGTNALMTEQPPGQVIAILEPLFAQSSLPQSATMRNASLILGCAYALNGDDERALGLWEAWLRICQAAGDGLVEANIAPHMSRVLIDRGRLHEAAALMEQFQQRADTPALRAIPAAGYAQALLASVAYAQNRLDTAIQLGTAAVQTLEPWSMPRIVLHAYVPLALARQARSDAEQANALITRARELIERGSLTQTFVPVAAYQARIWIAQGNLAAAAGWSEPWEQRFQTDLAPMHIVEALTLCRLLLAQDRLETVEALLARCVTLAERLGRRAHELEGRVLHALVARRRGDDAVARERLAPALALATATGVLRPFLDAGAPMAALLADPLVYGLNPGICERLLAALSAA